MSITAPTLLEITVLYWHQWFQEEPLTSMEPWKVLYSGESSLDCRNVLQIKNNGSERFFLEPKMFHLLLPFGIFILENVKQL